MDRDVSSLEPAIRAILTAPDVDLTTISAKRVRKQLAVQDPSLTEEWIRANRLALDAIIASVFTEIHPLPQDDVNGHGREHEAGPSDAKSWREGRKRVKDESEAGEKVHATGAEDDNYSENEGEGGGRRGDEEEKKRPAKKVRTSKSGMTDEEYAKQLSSELNGRPRSSRSAAKGHGIKGGRSGRAKTGRKILSSDAVDSDGAEDDDDDDAGKKRKKRTARGGFSKQYILSEPLAAVIQADRLSRPQVVKKLWEYIKGNNLQNPSNGKEILCDGSLRAVFGQDKIDMFRMNKVLGDHLHQVGE